MYRKTLSEYAKDDGYEDEEGCWYEDAESLLQTGILNFCGCGNPEESLLYVLKGLELIAERGPYDRSEFDTWYAGHRARLDEHFITRGAEYFFFYCCDSKGWTEHGSSVPGWLTEEGNTLLGLLQEWKELNKDLQC